MTFANRARVVGRSASVPGHVGLPDMPELAAAPFVGLRGRRRFLTQSPPLRVPPARSSSLVLDLDKYRDKYAQPGQGSQRVWRPRSSKPSYVVRMAVLNACVGGQDSDLDSLGGGHDGESGSNATAGKPGRKKNPKCAPSSHTRS